MKILSKFNSNNILEKDIKDLIHRKASRGVVLNGKGKIALIYSKNKDYYELPGGGVDDEESADKSFVRECLEEAGIKIEIADILGKTEEIDLLNKKIFNETTIFTAKALETIEPLEDDYDLIWKSPDEAIDIFNSRLSISNNKTQRYLNERAINILKEYMNNLS